MVRFFGRQVAFVAVRQLLALNSTVSQFARFLAQSAQALLWFAPHALFNNLNW